ncbi:MAG: hypothetical protein H6602_10745 [Flavobacteriales bacterium]|nr:hypothetical protein [Flavobacteriales bacterium]
MIGSFSPPFSLVWAIGSVSFAGSTTHFKLNGNLNKDIRLPFTISSTRCLSYHVGLTVCLAVDTFTTMLKMWVYILLGLSLSYWHPVRVNWWCGYACGHLCFLNSFTGMAAAFGGFLFTVIWAHADGWYPLSVRLVLFPVDCGDV